MANTSKSGKRVHVSPGVYTSESEIQVASKSLGITTLGLAGETVKGPAFQPISVSSWREFQSYFGGTSTEKYRGSKYPKYELPYIAKEYLEQSQQLEVVRTLGLSGVNAGDAWVISAYKDDDNNATYTANDPLVIAVLRSRGEHVKANFIQPAKNTDGERTVNRKTGKLNCEDEYEYDDIVYYAKEVKIERSSSLTLDDGCDPTYGSSHDSLDIDAANFGRFTLKVELSDGGVRRFAVSLNPDDKNYITKLLGTDPEIGDSEIYVEELYDIALQQLIEEGEINTLGTVGYLPKFRRTQILPEHKPVNDILTADESTLTRRDVGKRFLFGADSMNGDNPLTVHISDNKGIDWYPVYGTVGHIYTVRPYTTSDGTRKYYYCEYLAAGSVSDGHINISNKASKESVEHNANFVFTDSMAETDAKFKTDYLKAPEAKNGLVLEETVFVEADSMYYVCKQAVDDTEIKDERKFTVDRVEYTLSADGAFADRIIEKYVPMDAENHFELNDITYTLADNKVTFPAKSTIDVEECLFTYGGKIYKIEGGKVTTPKGATVNITNKKFTIGIEYTINDDNKTVTWAEVEGEETVNKSAIIDESNNVELSGGKIYKIEGGKVQELTVYSKDANGHYNLPNNVTFIITNGGTKLTVAYIASENVNGDKVTLDNVNYTIDSTNKKVKWNIVASQPLYTLGYQYRTEGEGAALKEYVFVSADVEPITLDLNNYKEQYRYASTPWVISELKGSATHVEINKLFRFHTISDGDNCGLEFKVSIENIDPDAGTFDVIVRDLYDTDNAPRILERFKNCGLVPGASNYIAYLIGSSDDAYETKSKYMTVEVNETDATQVSIPAGFMGYPVRDWSGRCIQVPVGGDEPNSEIGHRFTQPYMRYNNNVDDEVRVTKQYFGLSDITGIDTDVLKYKGVEAYNGQPEGMTPCFHLDSRLVNGKPEGVNDEGHYFYKDTPVFGDDFEQVIAIDGVEGYEWVTVGRGNTTTAGIEPRIGKEEDMYNTIYEDKRYRKFTLAFYGGWDGWDYYRTSRSNSNDFKWQKYRGHINSTSGEGTFFSVIKDPENYGFEEGERIITSDYYAYLSAIRQFSNPKTIDINVIATPGIDYVNNNLLVGDVVEMVEEERADSVYVVTTPDKPFGAGDSIAEMYTPSDAVANLDDSELDSNYACTFYPWVKVLDTTENQYIYLPPTKDVVKAFAYTDNIAQPWYAAAGYNRGQINGIKPKRTLKLGEQDTLYDNRINPINTFATEGMRIWGDKNLQKRESVMNRISKRRLMLRIRKLLAAGTIGLIFDPNDAGMGKTVRSALDTIMSDFRTKGGVVNYKIEIDDSQETRDRLEIGARILVKPQVNLEYITIELAVTMQGVLFENN